MTANEPRKPKSRHRQLPPLAIHPQLPKVRAPRKLKSLRHRQKPLRHRTQPARSPPRKLRLRLRKKPKIGSRSQQNALDSAESYLSISAFSRSSLIDQLEFEGFSNADATWAVDNVTV